MDSKYDRKLDVDRELFDKVERQMNGRRSRSGETEGRVRNRNFQPKRSLRDRREVLIECKSGPNGRVH